MGTHCSFDIFASFWIGQDLGPIEIAVIKSWIALGYSFELYTDLENLPTIPGCEFKEIGDLLPEGIQRAGRAANSVSDEFRFQLLKLKPGITWVDLDAIGWKRLPDTEHIFGFEDDNSVNIGVLRLPQTCPVIEEILQRIRSPRLSVFNDIGTKERIKFLMPHNLLSLSQTEPFPAQMISGPNPFTRLLDRHKLLHKAVSIPALYPIHHVQCSMFFEPGSAEFPDSYSIHLWNITRDRVARQGVPPGSRLDKILSIVNERYEKRP